MHYLTELYENPITTHNWVLHAHTTYLEILNGNTTCIYTKTQGHVWVRIISMERTIDITLATLQKYSEWMSKASILKADFHLVYQMGVYDRQFSHHGVSRKSGSSLILCSLFFLASGVNGGSTQPSWFLSQRDIDYSRPMVHIIHKGPISTTVVPVVAFISTNVTAEVKSCFVRSFVRP